MYPFRSYRKIHVESKRGHREVTTTVSLRGLDTDVRQDSINLVCCCQVLCFLRNIHRIFFLRLAWRALPGMMLTRRRQKPRSYVMFRGLRVLLGYGVPRQLQIRHIDTLFISTAPTRWDSTDLRCTFPSPWSIKVNLICPVSPMTPNILRETSCFSHTRMALIICGL